MQTVEDRLKALMLEGLAGHEASYRRLLTETGNRLRAYYGRRLGAGHEAVEDLVQETLIAVHTKRFTYDPGRPFTAWLHAIARYKMIDHLRETRARRILPLDDVADLIAPDESDAAGARMDVGRLLAAMPPRSRDLVRAVKIEGRSIEEVSTASGLSKSAVKVTVHRALKLISERIGNGKAP